MWPEAGLARARARAISTEMATSFANMRMSMSCHLFGRVPRYTPNAATQRDIDRVFEIWREELHHSGGPFLFRRFSVADAMFFPVRTRLRTYGVAIPNDPRRVGAAGANACVGAARFYSPHSLGYGR